MGNWTLGLDLGTNSIGWALVDHDDHGQPNGLTACGVRIFQEAVDLKTRTPKNRARREARQARRLTARRRMRRDTLLKYLVDHGFLPADQQERLALLTDGRDADPYRLRQRGLDEPLSLYEFGRVLVHLNQRRGFRSNRKAEFGELIKDPEVAALIAEEEAAARRSATSRRSRALADREQRDQEEGVIKAEIASLRDAIQKSGSRTLGEYLYGQPKRRGIHTDRTMYEDEFEALWTAQSRVHPELLTDERRAVVFQIMFHQRPLRTQRFLVGRCPLEPTRRRAPKALLEFQEFRLLQTLNNLRLRTLESWDWRGLTVTERSTLLGELQANRHLSWAGARRLLRLPRTTAFNLEEGGIEELPGNRTASELRRVIGPDFDAWDRARQRSLVTDLLTIDRKDALYRRLRGPAWEFPREIAYQLATAQLEPGYASCSLKAITKVLPYLEDGMPYSDALRRAGYWSPDEQIVALRALPEPPNLRNPVVNKALVEVRRVVNALIREYGFPSRICIELARDMKLTRKEKARQQQQNKENERANQQAAEQLHELGMIQEPDPQLAEREDLLKYRLWVECNKECPYTGQSLGINMLFSSAVDIEHILPYSRSLDDSFMNKTLCMAEFNRERKKALTPYEVFQGDPQRYAELLQRVQSMKLMPTAKRRRFELAELDTDDFVNRQLSDTRYISLAVRDYMKLLGVPVEVSRGEATAALRHNWGLSHILGGADQEGGKDRSDHRHHAVDAIVVALTSRALFQQLSRMSARTSRSLRESGFHLDPPWPGFLGEVAERVHAVIVSHAPRHKIAGALHEETAYGYDPLANCYAYRKPLASLKATEVEKIRDPVVRALVRERLAQFGGDVAKALANPGNPLFHRDGRTPIRSVRLAVVFNPKSVFEIPHRDGLGSRFVKLGNNHHVEILEHESTGRRIGVFVSAMEAADRARRRKVPIVQRIGPWIVDGEEYGVGWKFVMSLAVNDLVQVSDTPEGAIYRVQKLDGVGRVITLRLHNLATVDEAEGRLIKTPNSLKGKKASVSPIGTLSLTG
ncbi:MAG: type II CRISPR RNA-guided endonuclease Cas9 [Sulfobacillus sp.]